MGKQTKRSTIKALLIMMVAVMMISGCSMSGKGNGAGGDGGSGKVFTSSDGQVQFTLDKGWTEDPAIQKQAVLGVSQRKKEKYAMVNIVPKSSMADNATLEDFKAVVMTNLNAALTNPKESNNETIQVDSTEARLFEISGEAQKVKLHYLMALVDKGGAFYQVSTWSSQSKFSAVKEDLLKAIQSFKVVKEVPLDSVPSSPDSDKDAGTTTLKSDDKTLEITVPSYMTTELELSAEAEIQASRAAQEDYLIVLHERKDTFEDGFTMEDFHTAINDNMTNTLANPVQTEPKQIKVNGQPAIQYEVTGEVDKVKVAYLVTLVETDEHYTQVLFWTLQNRMDEKRDMFLEAASTFKVVK